METKEWLSAREAAARLGLSLRSFYAFRQRHGRPVAYRLGRLLKFKPEDLTRAYRRDAGKRAAER